MKKNIIAIILARSKSKGIKNKNIKRINGVPMIGLAAKCALKSKFINNVIISTDSKKYGKISQKYGADFFYLRSKKISGPNIKDESVLIDGLKQAEIYYKKKFDVIVSLPASTPTRSHNDLNEMISFFLKHNYESLWSVSKTDLKFHPLKQLIMKDNKLKYFDKRGKNIINRQQLFNNVYHRNGVAYIISRNFLINKKKLIGNNSAGYFLKGNRISIDTLKDLYFAKKLLKNKNAK